ncbi:hypothetical protein ABZ565_04300 [Streptomyces sp. NPDC016469]|uniref:hypothetical protein n=1 Tax=Streptomyces sp. NPDC016469 TaxID=3157191 RepID=UPI003404C7B8
MNTSGRGGSSSAVHEWINTVGVVFAVGLSLFSLHRDQTQRADDEVREAMKVSLYWTGTGEAPTGVLVENQQSIRIMDVTVRLKVGDATVQHVRFGEVHSCTQDSFSFGAHQPHVRTDALFVLQFRDATGHWWQMKPGPVLDRIDSDEAHQPGGIDLVSAWNLKRGTGPSSGCDQ